MRKPAWLNNHGSALTVGCSRRDAARRRTDVGARCRSNVRAVPTSRDGQIPRQYAGSAARIKRNGDGVGALRRNRLDPWVGSTLTQEVTPDVCLRKGIARAV
jgi:hypothetical protein